MSHGWPGGGGQLSLLSLHALWDTRPPPKPGTHGPPPNPSAFQRKSTPYVSDSFTLQLTMGGQRAGRLSSKPPTLIGGLESMCPLQGQELL